MKPLEPPFKKIALLLKKNRIILTKRVTTKTEFLNKWKKYWKKMKKIF